MTKKKQNIRADCAAAFEDIQMELNTVIRTLHTLKENLRSLEVYNARMLEVFGTPNYGKEFVV